MHDERRAPRTSDHIDEAREISLGVLVIDADAALDCNGNAHGAPHRRNAARHQLRFRHQAGAKPPVLHTGRRATTIEIDLVVAKPGPDFGRLGQRIRIRPTQLQRHRMLGCIEPEQALALPMDNSARGDHLGVEQRAR